MGCVMKRDRASSPVTKKTVLSVERGLYFLRSRFLYTITSIIPAPIVMLVVLRVRLEEEPSQVSKYWPGRDGGEEDFCEKGFCAR